MNQHADVAAYALGVLDSGDADRFEEHLVSCEACAQELESLLPVVDLLGDVPAPHVPVPHERARRPASRSLLGLAAGLLLLAAVGGGSFVAGARWAEPDPAFTALPAPSATPATTASPAPGERLVATDARTGVAADVRLESRPWGTRISFSVSKVEGPRTCSLIAVRRSGPAVVLSSWTVPPAGYGTRGQPRPLELEAATAVRREDITELKVQTVEDGGPGETLVRIST